jgi:hypothetical protein
VVNHQSGLHLHRFNWLTDEVIGALPVTWNYLEGWHSAEDCADPIAVHFTRGGPWFEQWQGVEYGAEWISESGVVPMEHLSKSGSEQPAHRSTGTALS